MLSLINPELWLGILLVYEHYRKRVNKWQRMLEREIERDFYFLKVHLGDSREREREREREMKRERGRKRYGKRKRYEMIARYKKRERNRKEEKDK